MANNNTLTIGEFIKLCLAKWKWFAISVVTVMLLAIAYLVITPPKYTKKAAAWAHSWDSWADWQSWADL